MDKFSKLLKEYFMKRSELEEAYNNLVDERKSCRSLLPADNQTKFILSRFAHKNNIPFDDYTIIKHMWNEKCIPLTMMRTSDLRKISAQKCKEAKKAFKEAQKNLQVVLRKLRELVA